MALSSIVLLLLTTMHITFIHANAVQNSQKYITYQERMQVPNNVILLAPYPESAAVSVSNPQISHSFPAKSPGSSPSVALTPGSAPSSNIIDGTDNIVDVRSNGAVGDGKTDDTAAFKVTWQSACNKTYQAKILVPKGYSFLLQPISFSGPCQNSMIFQVFF
jgi:polygalacturonase